MIWFFLSGLAVMAVALSILMTGAWLIQQRTGNSGWVDTIWTFCSASSERAVRSGRWRVNL